ncbi:MAG: 2-succinyl-5-enolpyruvyl-6-hydroxy-3-cyclohexene-1-carboxylic-acid synthase [Deltaproteobacteria bacterium]|nr:2-succinyl-5-enolpyruvyl-6-hydroxy-3-cyclohexene-1-carboxylic-acid synthase [Deltaproteobacteria bacterium]
MNVVSEPSDTQACWYRSLVDGFVAAGVLDVVVSPGSRSTSIVLALAERPELRLQGVHDERSAAFFALGQARVTGRPSLFVCTSGTAGGHALPAVMEASAAYVPLLVLTADRPCELHYAGAPQTVDQRDLFGHHVRKFFEAGAPEEGPLALRAIRRLAVEACTLARSPVPGPVHLNARARKPLEFSFRAEDGVGVGVGLRVGGPFVGLPVMAASEDAIARLSALVSAAKRGLVVAGPSHRMCTDEVADVHDFVARTRFPLLPEAASQLRFANDGNDVGPDGTICIDGFDAIVRASTFSRAYQPDLIIQLGAAPTSAALSRYLAASPGTRRVVVTPYGWPDPESHADLFVFGPVGSTLRRVLLHLDGSEATEPAESTELAGAIEDAVGARAVWAAAWRDANARVWAALDAAAADADDDEWLELRAVRAVFASVPEGGIVMLGNSLAIRHADGLVPASTVRPLRAVLSQRGVNGIDGLISGAAGSALAAECPLVLILGDVSCLHDVSGLLAAQKVKTPFVIVVLNNGGGRIFEQLPVRALSLSDAVWSLFSTPHALEIARVAEALGVRGQRVESVDALDASLSKAWSFDGVTLIEVKELERQAKGPARWARLLESRVDAALTASDQASKDGRP